MEEEPEIKVGKVQYDPLDLQYKDCYSFYNKSNAFKGRNKWKTIIQILLKTANLFSIGCLFKAKVHIMTREGDTNKKERKKEKMAKERSIKLSTVSEQLSTGSEQVSTVSAKKSTSSVDKGQK
ncbi:hypothetical protein Tco_1186140 [Tanacetum coccineum]